MGDNSWWQHTPGVTENLGVSVSRGSYPLTLRAFREWRLTRKIVCFVEYNVSTSLKKLLRFSGCLSYNRTSHCTLGCVTLETNRRVCLSRGPWLEYVYENRSMCPPEKTLGWDQRVSNSITLKRGRGEWEKERRTGQEKDDRETFLTMSRKVKGDFATEETLRRNLKGVCLSLWGRI